MCNLLNFFCNLQVEDKFIELTLDQDGKSKHIKDNYDRLHRIALNSNPKDFEEPKVDGKLQKSEYRTHLLSVIRRKWPKDSPQM